MNVSFIDAARQQVELVYNSLAAYPADCALIVYGVKEKEAAQFIRYVEEKTPFNCKISAQKRRLKIGDLYVVAEDDVFSFDGEFISIREEKDDSAGQALSAKEQLELITNHYPNGYITLLDSDLRIIYTAGESFHVYGLDPARVRGKLVSEVLLPEINQALEEAVTKVSSDAPVEFEVNFEGKIFQNTCTRVQGRDKSLYYVVRVLDITDTRMIMAAFQESEARHRYIINMSRELICTHAPDGTYKFVSPSSYNLLGYKPTELVGKNPYEYFHPEDVKRIIDNSHLPALGRGSKSHIQYRFRKKDGSYIWLDTYTDTIRDSKGKVTSLITGSRDITELKMVEIKLRESDERFRGIADNIPGVIYLCMNDESYSMIYLNNEVKNLTGYDRELFVDKKLSFVDLYHPDDKQQVIEKVDHALEHKEPFNVCYRIKSRNNGWVWVDEYGQGIYENGKLKYIEGVLLNITERKSAEEKLVEREANLKAIFESTNSIIGLFDKNKKLIEYNQAFAEYAKRNRGIELYQGMDIIAEMGEEFETMFNGFQDRALLGEKFSETIEFPTAGGNLYFLCNHNPIYQNDEVTGVSVFVEDITALTESQRKLEQHTENLEQLVEKRTQELKEKNEALHRGNEELENALNSLKDAQAQLVQAEKMASLGVLSAGIGHEINNPLNFIKNGCSALLQNLQEEDLFNEDEFKPYFDIIDDGVRRASDIVKSLGHFSRQVKACDEQCFIHDIMDNCLVILNSRLKDRVDVEKRYCDKKLMILGNEGKLHQAFLNVLSNAEQAVGDLGQIVITTQEEHKMVSITVQDNGIGIPDSNLSKIGDPFFTTKEPGKGTGLGLFITYSIVKELNGQVKVESEEKKGSKFTLTFPKPLDLPRND